MKQWSKIHTSCVRCETTERSHYARGMCERCWEAWIAENPVTKEPESFDDVESSMTPLPACLTPDRIEHPTAIQKVNIIVGASDGWSLDELAQEVGLSGRTVAEVIERHDYEVRTMTRMADYKKPVYRLRLLQRMGMSA